MQQIFVLSIIICNLFMFTSPLMITKKIKELRLWKISRNPVPKDRLYNTFGAVPTNYYVVPTLPFELAADSKIERPDYSQIKNLLMDHFTIDWTIMSIDPVLKNRKDTNGIKSGSNESTFINSTTALYRLNSTDQSKFVKSYIKFNDVVIVKKNSKIEDSYVKTQAKNNLNRFENKYEYKINTKLDKKFKKDEFNPKPMKPPIQIKIHARERKKSSKNKFYRNPLTKTRNDIYLHDSVENNNLSKLIKVENTIIVNNRTLVEVDNMNDLKYNPINLIVKNKTLGGVDFDFYKSGKNNISSIENQPNPYTLDTNNQPILNSLGVNDHTTLDSMNVNNYKNKQIWNDYMIDYKDILEYNSFYIHSPSDNQTLTGHLEELNSNKFNESFLPPDHDFLNKKYCNYDLIDIFIKYNLNNANIYVQKRPKKFTTCPITYHWMDYGEYQFPRYVLQGFCDQKFGDEFIDCVPCQNHDYIVYRWACLMGNCRWYKSHQQLLVRCTPINFP